MKMIKANSIVKLQYIGTLDNGEIFDMCDETDPVEFEMGSGIMIQAFEDALIGMGLNEKKRFVIPSDKAFGPVSENTVKTLSLSDFESEVDFKSGDIVAVELEEDEVTPATVIKVDEDAISIDMNHPLAGKNLNFEVEILEIVDPEDDKEPIQ